MKSSLIFLFILTSTIGFAQFDSERIAREEAKSHQYINQPLFSAVSDNYDLKYHRMQFTVDPAVRYIRGGVTSFFIPITSGFNEINFDLTTSLTVDSVRYHGSAVTFVQLAGDRLKITLPSVIPLNNLDSVSVYYQGIPPNDGFGSFAQTTHSGVPVIWTLSEPYGAKVWWPCKQSLTDKVDSIDVFITTPQAYRAASNGVLLSETLSGVNKIYHWQSHYPIAAYLVAFAVTNYAVYSDFLPQPSGTLEILNYVYPENLAYAQSLTPGVLNTIDLFDSLTIPYPFANEKYGHCQFSWGGGMEHQTMSFVSDFPHWLLAHELAHQWFGDMVTCGSWQDIWLNEGFATYFEGLSEEFLFPATWQTWKTNKKNNITSQTGGSVLCDDTTSVNRIFSGRLTYDKGAYLLHMLRWKLGNEDFFEAIKNYLNDPELTYGYAKTPDLITHFENVSGQNLSGFFNQWYYNQGYPSYQIFWYQNGNNLTVKINQSQSHASVNFFQMPVPIKFSGGGNDTILVFEHNFSGQVFSKTINFTASTATFDPDLWLISKNNTVTFDGLILNLKAYFQGFYKGGGEMQPVLFNVGGNSSPIAFDSIEVELHDVGNPDAIVATGSAIAGTSGNAQFYFSASQLLNHSYYIVVKHRNSLETWSKNPVLFNSTNMSYDFSTAAIKAHGNNQADLGDTRFAIFSGDVDQDGLIDSDDYSSTGNQTTLFLSGYLIQDFNGDGQVESADISLLENNLGRITSRP